MKDTDVQPVKGSYALICLKGIYSWKGENKSVRAACAVMKRGGMEMKTKTFRRDNMTLQFFLIILDKNKCLSPKT